MQLESQNKKKERMGKKYFFKIMAENFPKLLKDINPQTQETQGTPSRTDTKKIKIPQHNQTVNNQKKKYFLITVNVSNKTCSGI